MQDIKEKWVRIENVYGNYSVSDQGNVRNDKTNRILKKQIVSNGYHGVGLKSSSDTGAGAMKYVHRLVLQAFSDFPLEQANHINGIKTDNRLSNLENVSAKENMRHAVKTGLKKPPAMFLSMSQAMAIRDHYANGIRTEIIMGLFQISFSTLKKVVRSKYQELKHLPPLPKPSTVKNKAILEAFKYGESVNELAVRFNHPKSYIKTIIQNSGIDAVRLSIKDF